MRVCDVCEVCVRVRDHACVKVCGMSVYVCGAKRG